MNIKKINILIIISILIGMSFLANINLVSAINYDIELITNSQGTIFLHINSDPPQYYFTSGTHSIPEGTGIRFTATGNEGYNFIGWEVDGEMLPTSLNPMYLNVTEAFSIKAIFSVETTYYDIGIVQGTNGQLYVTYDGDYYFSGYVSVLAGAQFTLHSIADEDYTFYRFISGASVFWQDHFSIIASGDANFTPEFILTSAVNDTYFVTLETDAYSLVSMQTTPYDGGFPVSSAVAGTFQVQYNDTVSLNAVPLNDDHQLVNVTLNDIPQEIDDLPIYVVANQNLTFIVNGKSLIETPSTLELPYPLTNANVAIGIYISCIVAMIIAFYYLHNSNVPFAFCIGLGLATIICNVINVLGFYTYPIDAITIILIVGIIIFMKS